MSRSSIPFVSVIIPVYNDAIRLEKCLKALEAQRYASDRYEVVVVDNGSSEPMQPTISKFKHAVAAYEAQPGSYAARNKGIELAKADVLAFTDGDCIPHEDWLANGVQTLAQNAGCGLVGGRIDIFFADEKRPTAVELFDALWGFPQEEYISIDQYAVTANLITRRDVFEKVGLFNSRLKSGGDREWGERVVAAGYKVVYGDDVCVGHPARRTLSELARKIVRVSGGRFDRIKQRPGSHYWDLVKDLLWSLRPPFRAISKIRSDEKTQGLGTGLRVLGVMLFVRYLTAAERLRLMLGGRSRR